MAHRCIHGEMVPTSITHGKCKINAGKPHYASTCPFTYYYWNCNKFTENPNYEQEKAQEKIDAEAAKCVEPDVA